MNTASDFRGHKNEAGSPGPDRVSWKMHGEQSDSLFEANGVQEISDNSLILPINVSYGSGYIMINSEMFD